MLFIAVFITLIDVNNEGGRKTPLLVNFKFSFLLLG